MMNRYKQLLTYIRSAVTRNYSEKSINSILDYISTSKQVRMLMLIDLALWRCVLKPVLSVYLFSSLFQKMDLLQEFYETTLEALKDAKNDRLWFKTNTKVYGGSSMTSAMFTSPLFF